MSDEKHLVNMTLYKISFPAFWEIAYREKNLFYHIIRRHAEKFVAEMGRGEEYLEGDKVRYFFHEHCTFCMEKAMTDNSSTFYCTDDLRCWICSECFSDLRERFNWQEKQGEELPGLSEGSKVKS